MVEMVEISPKTMPMRAERNPAQPSPNSAFFLLSQPINSMIFLLVRDAAKRNFGNIHSPRETDNKQLTKRWGKVNT